MDFFTSPKDLQGWVKSHESADEAANKLIDIIGNDEQQDVVDTCRAIFERKDDNASEVLFEVLARHNLTQIKEGSNMNNKMRKQADSGIQRGQAPLYQSMPLRVCPKLPYSAGKRVISTWNCREHCLDSICLDDDPLRVYCAEALWRRHIMDKFSREFKDKDGKWVGGYINQRFQVFHDDGGNQMELANGERTRKPRSHQYSIERRLSEGRGEETYDITASSNKVVKVASVKQTNEDDDKIYEIFDDIVDMKEAGLSDEDIIYKVSEHYDKSIHAIASLHRVAMKQLSRHGGILYAHENKKMHRTAQASMIPNNSTMVTKKEVSVTSLSDGQQRSLRIETPVVLVSNNQGGKVFEIVDGPDAGQRFNMQDIDIQDSLGVLEDSSQGMIQDAAQEVGLNEQMDSTEPDDFPIVEAE